MNEYLELKIITRLSVIFEGKVRSVTSFNKKGKFDILPGHSQFISLVTNGISFFDERQNQKSLVLANGVVRVIKNTITVFCEIQDI
ncbi:MAG: hypothetical protein HY044_00080 [Candidatus Woesebacteria bacterium]|nr:MAG: hypothetical protein HY044_00080 [Candidatus Woesebacteria bacterium]